MRIKNWLIAALFLVSPSLYAHTGGHIDHSLMSGLLHPLTGIDHLLVLIAVGLIAAKQGGKALFAFPAVFFGLMAAGALFNAYGVQIPFVESLLALSVAAFGLLVSIGQRQRSKILFLGVSFFAVFHGYAHAAEIPTDSSAVQYFSALMLMSLVICASGCVVGLTTGKRINYLFSLICLSSGLYYLAAG
ncbi:HupE/UreJ family protein [Methylobacter sp.]|uniref:HupE/UreJ family protein n=1 Tax=Methylobacter sp. TaxID=2051955 RepID=UPI00121FF810|nr:HupE/UreJ family protein [Methylobacter sp.]TAK64485.1 MAG: HupE/UreJ family protein [Methylobacter sp.]